MQENSPDALNIAPRRLSAPTIFYSDTSFCFQFNVVRLCGKKKTCVTRFSPNPLEIGAENNLCCLLLDSDPAVITQLWFFMEVLGLLVAVWSSVYDMAPRLDLHQHWLVPSPPLLLLLLFNLLLLLLLHCDLFQTT